MNSSRFMHKQAENIDCVHDVKASDAKVDQRSQ